MIGQMGGGLLMVRHETVGDGKVSVKIKYITSCIVYPHKSNIRVHLNGYRGKVRDSKRL